MSKENTVMDLCTVVFKKDIQINYMGQILDNWAFAHTAGTYSLFIIIIILQNPTFSSLV